MTNPLFPRTGRRWVALAAAALVGGPTLVAAATWTPLTNTPPGSVETMLLLTDGTVIAHSYDSPGNIWRKLTPSATGSYINGTWSTAAPMGTNRIYFASHVLPNGNLWVLGGEYSGPNLTANWTNTGEVYDTLANHWTPIAPHPESQFGDVPSMLLDKGKILAGSLFNRTSFLYDINTNTWAATGNKVYNDSSDEETYVKLPDGSVMTYDLFQSIATGGAYAEAYVPKAGTWAARSPSDGTSSGSIPQLSSPAMGYELGAALTMRSKDNRGKVFYIGATGHTAVYSVGTNSWAPGPDIIGRLNGNPALFGSVDAPAAEAPNGHIIFAADASPTTGSAFSSPTQLFDYDPKANTIQLLNPAPPVTMNEPAYVHRMLVLPNGQIMFTRGGSDVWIYTPDGSAPKSARPEVQSVRYQGGGLFTLSGRRLNGISSGSSYGDDAESDENYPIVRFGQPAGGLVWYGRSFNWKNTGVQVKKTTTTDFTLKAGTPAGALTLVVSGAGIESTPVCLALTADQVAGTGPAADIPLTSCTAH